MVKPIEMGKRSGFENKEFKTGGVTTKEFPTRAYGEKSRFPTTQYGTHPFSYSSKSYSTRTAPLEKPAVATPRVDAPAHADSIKRVEAEAFQTTQMERRSLPGAIADKPTRDWQTFIRKELPHRAGPHSNIPFSRWKATSGEKGTDTPPSPRE